LETIDFQRQIKRAHTPNGNKSLINKFLFILWRKPLYQIFRPFPLAFLGGQDPPTLVQNLDKAQHIAFVRRKLHNVVTFHRSEPVQ
jgi:hypothetical protein